MFESFAPSCELRTLETRDLLLRKAEYGDAQDIFEYSKDEEVARYVLWYPHRSPADSRDYIRYLKKQYRYNRPSSYCIVEKISGRVIGTIGYMTITDDMICEVGYSLGRNYWNRGYMTQALKEVLRYGLEELKLRRIEAVHDVRNPASGKVMLKAGMKFEGTLRDKIFAKGRYITVDMYAVVAGDELPA